MEWLKVIIYTTSEGIEPLTGVLYQVGVTGVEIEDEADFSIFFSSSNMLASSLFYCSQPCLMECSSDTPDIFSLTGKDKSILILQPLSEQLQQQLSLKLLKSAQSS